MVSMASVTTSSTLSSVWKWQPLTLDFNFGNKQKLWGENSGEWGACRSTGMHFSPECFVCWRIVVMKVKGSNRLQFPFKLASPSFSDSPGFQDNICDSLWHQVVQIFMNYPLRIENKLWPFFDFWFAYVSFLLSSRLCLLVSRSYSKYQFWSPAMTR
jgi:hypothetical protein